MFKKLGIKDNELEGLLAQAACHAPTALNQMAFDQLVTAAILAKGEEKLNSTFVGQVILNASTKANENTLLLPHCESTYYPNSLSEATLTGTSAPLAHWQEDCTNTRAVVNPIHAKSGQGHQKNGHLWPQAPGTNGMATLRVPVRGGLVVIGNVAFSNKLLGTILSIGRLCRAGVFPLFSGLMLSLVVPDHLVTTTFHNNCWWMNVTVGEETNESAAETSSLPLIERNPLSCPATSKLSCREWHPRSTRLPIPINHTRPCLDVQHCLSAEVEIGCAGCNTGCNCTSVCSTEDQPERITDRQCQGACLRIPHCGTLKARYWSSSIAALFATGEWQSRASQLHPR
ncbi:hypothetical protein O181_056970 [Austropuccinia psidii MF-1]|uniref:Uncharacterized protein n=1 Tax=Austropuccinia psidii MF-1 TaxID=1389203 RepID=A0A9Q3HWK2_9BASI|nr:hypothetical protein [Austropuccinia psidii MF-1]